MKNKIQHQVLERDYAVSFLLCEEWCQSVSPDSEVLQSEVARPFSSLAMSHVWMCEDGVDPPTCGS